MHTLHRFGPLTGRILIALIFVLSGVGKLAGFQGTVGYIASQDLPAPQLLAIAAIVVEIGGGLMLMLGWRARWAATALFVLTALAALLFHGFWAAPAEQAQIQMIMFMKNLSMMGGLLYVLVYGSGSLSLGKD